MQLSWKLGRVAGIDVYLHPTFLLLLLFLGAQGGGAMAILLLVLVFGCVLLHELGHALMARQFGIETADITLYPIGGVARLRRFPRAPGAELLIALAGPAVNFAIVTALALLGMLGVTELFAESMVGFVISQLMLVNVALGLFNLIPAFPMDGGRVLRAVLSAWMSRVTATTIAATIGRTLAVLFGLLALVSMNVNSNWLIHVALAAFIYFAATAELNQVVADERRRHYGAGSQGVWVAPAGFRWVDRGNGVWQLAPTVVGFPEPDHVSSR
jgi:Zn-dependent protease